MQNFEPTGAAAAMPGSAVPQIKRRLAISACLLIPLFYLGLGAAFGLPLPPFLTGDNAMWCGIVQLVLTVPVCWLNRSYFINGCKSIRAPGPDTLVALSSGAALVYGIIAIFTQDAPQELFLPSAAAILIFAAACQLLEVRFKAQAMAPLHSLAERIPETACVLRSRQQYTVPLNEVAVGDIFLIRPGDVMPVDGVVIEGETTVDESALTGAAAPVAKHKGSTVYAATANQGGALICRATRIGPDSTAAQLVHTVQTTAAGYTRLEEAEYWNLEPEHGYYVTRNESSIIAWRVPAHAIGGWRIAASHSDSPTWRIKNTNVNAAGCIKLNVEGYGGMIMSTWLDRPLSAAGRVLVRDEAAGTLESRLVDLDRDLLVIPSLAIHMDRTLNSGHAFNPQVDMQPLYGLEGSKPFPALLAEAADVKEEDIVDFDLSLYTRQAPTRIGPDGELFMAPRIDDLECAATTLYGFLDAAPETDSACAPVWAMFDNEEVGSSTRQGADSSFLRDVLDRILNAIPHSAQAQAQAFANSFVLSADNAHAVHPNFADKADPCNKVILGKGVVVKVNASQKYTTSGLTGAIFKEICRKNNVPVQVFANRADLPGGSTLGNLQSHTVPVPMVDIGLAQLAMHSAVETAAVADADAMVRAVAGFYRVHLRSLGDARYTLE